MKSSDALSRDPKVIPKRPLQPQTACRHSMDNLLLSGKKIISRTNFHFVSNYNSAVESTLLENVSLAYTRRVEARKDGLQMTYTHGTTHTHNTDANSHPQRHTHNQSLNCRLWWWLRGNEVEKGSTHEMRSWACYVEVTYSHCGKDILSLSNHGEVVHFPNDSNDVTYRKCRTVYNHSQHWKLGYW